MNKRRLYESILERADRGLYCLKVCARDDDFEALRFEGFKVSYNEENECTISWYDSCDGLAGAIRTLSLKRKTAMVEELVRSSMKCKVAFLIPELYPENLEWVKKECELKYTLEVHKEHDGIGFYCMAILKL